MAAASVSSARLLTVASWFTYPFVYIITNVGFAGPVATVLGWVHGAASKQEAGLQHGSGF